MTAADKKHLQDGIKLMEALIRGEKIPVEPMSDMETAMLFALIVSKGKSDEVGENKKKNET